MGGRLVWSISLFSFGGVNPFGWCLSFSFCGGPSGKESTCKQENAADGGGT